MGNRYYLIIKTFYIIMFINTYPTNEIIKQKKTEVKYSGLKYKLIII
jgi:hypothetical protein